MSIRKKEISKLRGLVNLIPEWIEKYKYLYGLQNGRPLSVNELIDIMDEAVDRKTDFIAIKTLMAFEQKNLSDFQQFVAQVQNVVQNNQTINLRSYNKLRSELIDSFEAIKLSYITIDDYTNYERTKNNMIEEIENHRPVLLAEIELNKKSKRK